MTELSIEQLRATPLTEGLTDEQIKLFGEVFERREVAEGERLFSAGESARAMYMLVDGEVTLTEGDQVRMTLHPPAPIGELGVLSPNITRNTTATATVAGTVWVVARDRLGKFFEANAQLGLKVYRNFTEVMAAKIGRDQVRLEDMRGNLIRTQKTMKRLRDFVLESEDTLVSERIHDTLDKMIVNNRRANYRVAPPKKLPATVRIDGGSRQPVVQISRTHISYRDDDGALPEEKKHLIGVIDLGGTELPFSGSVLRTIDRRVDIELDLLIDEYVAGLESYLSRVQMADFVV